jgi:hypothetical protein
MSKVPEAVKEFLRKQASKGGKIGGRRRWAGTTPEERSEHMRSIASKRKRPGRKKKA